MRWIVSAATLSLAALWAVTQSAPALAQTLRNPQIEIEYVEPKDASFRPIYERLKRRLVLEELQSFLAPLQLPSKVLIKVDQCGGATTVPYRPQGAVTICYEFVDQFERLAPEYAVAIGAGSDAGSVRLYRDDALIGAFVHHALHEVAIAAFDILQIPFFGREEFAADNVAAYIMLQFGPEAARKSILGTVWLLSQTGATGIGEFYSPRSTDAQRFFNFLCIAYVADPRSFGFVSKSLPQGRIEFCKQDYEKLQYSFDAVIMPHIDQDLLKLARANKWLQPGR